MPNYSNTNANLSFSTGILVQKCEHLSLAESLMVDDRRRLGSLMVPGGRLGCAHKTSQKPI